MPMYRLLNKFRHDASGNTVIEFALMAPVLLLLFSGLLEIGRAHYQAVAVEKGLRAAAVYAARSPFPLSAADLQIAENIARTGTRDGTGDALVAGWDDAGATLSIDSSASYALSETYSVPLIQVSASVPMVPLVPNLFNYVGLTPDNIVMAHEQAHVGS